MRTLLALVVLSLVAGDSQALGRRRARASEPVYVQPTYSPVSSGTPLAASDALGEVNAARAARGLRPYVLDPLLTRAAEAAASFRAAHRIHGHTRNDFAYLPPGSSASAAGCGALEPSWGWGACCTYDRYTYAGAAVVYGADGRRYMHIFVR